MHVVLSKLKHESAVFHKNAQFLAAVRVTDTNTTSAEAPRGGDARHPCDAEKVRVVKPSSEEEEEIRIEHQRANAALHTRTR